MDSRQSTPCNAAFNCGGCSVCRGAAASTSIAAALEYRSDFEEDGFMVRSSLRILQILLLTLFAALPAQAEGGKTILVFDASGSMWGQVEGEAKITIAQRVLGDLLETLPADQQLGLMAYGHRRKGDCSDIELLVPPGPDTRAAIRKAVDGISPKGKTPLSQAVIDAAEALKYEEEPATVILLTDGIETCNLDPCAVGADLEKTGVNFTAHVIGFDVADKKEQEQLRCLAENTGGKFLPAANAAELADALEQVSVEEPAPAPVELDVLFRATDGDKGPQIDEPLVWTVTSLADGSVVADHENAATLERTLPPGQYRVEVLRPSDEATATREVTLEAGTGQLIVTLVLESPLPKATLEAPAAAPAGSAVVVAWTGPGIEGDYIAVSAPGSADDKWINYGRVKANVPKAEVVLPTVEGPYELRYVDKRGRVLARRAIEATPIQATLTLPASAPAGSTVEVGWSGPGYKGDYISVVEAEKSGSAYVNYEYVRDKPTVGLLMPAVPGSFEVRYVLGQDKRILARQTIAVEPVSATLTAPDSAAAGATIKVEWTGPGYRSDYISVSKPDERDGAYINYSYLRDGSPTDVQLPPTPGVYELRYVVNQDQTVLARRAITVTEVGATLTILPSAPAGSSLDVTWSGPNYQGDYISVSKPEAGDGEYLYYSYAREGSPLKLQLPVDPGSYEVRYVVGQDRVVLARAALEVTAVSASLIVQSTAPAGATLPVGWSGPGYDGDYLTVVAPGAEPGEYVNYVYLRDGANPAMLLLPPDPGRYEVRYVDGNGPKVLASQPIETTKVTATLKAPPSGKAGGEIPVTWTGPAYDGDFISVTRTDGDPSSYIEYVYLRDASPATLRLPAEPGRYEIRYVMSQGPRVLAKIAVTVE